MPGVEEIFIVRVLFHFFRKSIWVFLVEPFSPIFLCHSGRKPVSMGSSVLWLIIPPDQFWVYSLVHFELFLKLPFIQSMLRFSLIIWRCDRVPFFCVIPSTRNFPFWQPVGRSMFSYMVYMHRTLPLTVLFRWSYLHLMRSIVIVLQHFVWSTPVTCEFASPVCFFDIIKSPDIHHCSGFIILGLNFSGILFLVLVMSFLHHFQC
jgi:hypothetical protein